MELHDGNGTMSRELKPKCKVCANKMHCFEGALFAATALWVNREQPLMLDFKNKGDDDHVVALYKRNGCWGAISKTNHATLRYRDPVYKTIRELAMSYFHEYWRVSDGKKTLISHSTKPFDLRVWGEEWVTAETDLDELAEAVDVAPHNHMYPKQNAKFIRLADAMERRAGKLIEWKKSDPRT
jgi:hypothetical protein